MLLATVFDGNLNWAPTIQLPVRKRSEISHHAMQSFKIKAHYGTDVFVCYSIWEDFILKLALSSYWWHVTVMPSSATASLTVFLTMHTK